MVKELTHFIGGTHVKGKSGRFLDVTNPNTGEITARTPLASADEMRAAVAVAAKAFPEWAATNPQRRARVMFEFKRLLEANMNELAMLLSLEHGKVLADSRGDVQRGLEVIEFACGIPHLQKGEFTEGAGPGIDMYSMRQPLGVVAGITPFNFPAMIPMWMFGVAIACGNTFILKPSEKDPSVPMRLAELFLEAGAPDLIGSAYGSAGERCMALPVAVPVGKDTADRLLEKLIPRVQALKIGTSTDPESDYGPLVSRAHMEKVRNYIDLAVKEGAKLVVDGRDFKLQGYENGFFLGGCLFDNVTPDMKTYQEEIFGPVLQIVRAKTFEEAAELPTKHQYGNGVAIFTRDGDAARSFASRVQVGMVGINVPIPVPLAYHSFGGWKRSAFGDTNQHGTEGVKFWTKVKTVTSRWPTGVKEGSSFVIPTMG